MKMKLIQITVCLVFHFLEFRFLVVGNLENLFLLVVLLTENLLKTLGLKENDNVILNPTKMSAYSLWIIAI